MFYAFTSGLVGLSLPPAVRGMGAAYTPAQVQAMIVQAAQAQGVPPNLALGIASHESGFNSGALNQNTNGTTDYGVMQLNTSVLQTYGVSPTAALDPQTNALIPAWASWLPCFRSITAISRWRCGLTRKVREPWRLRQAVPTHRRRVLSITSRVTTLHRFSDLLVWTPALQRIRRLRIN